MTSHEKALEHTSNLHICFVDLPKAFDSVSRHALTNILKYSGIEDEVVRLIVDLHDGIGCVVRSKFEVTTGVHQGYVLSAILFNLLMGINCV